jgi:hypothetical protein
MKVACSNEEPLCKISAQTAQGKYKKDPLDIHTDRQTDRQTDRIFVGRRLNPALAGAAELASGEVIFDSATLGCFARAIFTSARWRPEYRPPTRSGENCPSLRNPAPLRQKSTSPFASPCPPRLRREKRMDTRSLLPNDNSPRVIFLFRCYFEAFFTCDQVF